MTLGNVGSCHLPDRQPHPTGTIAVTPDLPARWHFRPRTTPLAFALTAEELVASCRRPAPGRHRHRSDSSSADCAAGSRWSGRRESNPRMQLGKLPFCH